MTQKYYEDSEYIGFTPIEVVQSTLQNQRKPAQNWLAQSVSAVDMVDVSVNLAKGLLNVSGALCGLLAAGARNATVRLQEDTRRRRHNARLRRISEADQLRMAQYRSHEQATNLSTSSGLCIQVNGGENHITIKR